MGNKRFKRQVSFIPADERRRRKRDGIIIVVVVALVALLTLAENRIIHFGAGSDLPFSNTILMFILININLLLLILLIFLVFRNLVKLLYDRNRRVMGANLRTRLVVAFVALSLVPTIVLFFFSINFINSSIEFWFNVPVEQALENSLVVGRRLYGFVEESNSFFLERISYQIQAKDLLKPENQRTLDNYVQIVQREFNLDAVEVYTADHRRVAASFCTAFQEHPVEALSSDLLQRELLPNGVRTVTERIAAGELIRTIATVPFGISREGAQAFVVLSLAIPPELSEKMASISQGFEGYQQIKLFKRPIQITYYITLSIVALLVMFCAIWFGFYLAKSITIPIQELAEGTRRVAEGDLSFSIGLVADDEIGSLVSSFNKMTRDLRMGREQLELSAHMLQEQNAEIEEKRQYMEIVLKNVTAGVISLDAGGFVTTINKSAERMLNLKGDEILRRNFRKLLHGEYMAMAEETLEKLTVSRQGIVEFPLRVTTGGRPRSFMVQVNALKDDSSNHMGAVVVFDDLTELEKAQRMAAWREVARRIAHEVKNPLTPIKLSAQRLKRKYGEQVRDPVFTECTQTIIDHVDLIRNLVNEFSAFARFPTANPERCDLAALIEETLALYREGHTNILFGFEVADNIPPLKLDRQQMKQAMINLIDNAVGSIRTEGEIRITLSHDPILKKVRIEVADTGTGISDLDKTRLFEPYFSTKKAGMGLGLTIVSTIIADHGGMISVKDNLPQGARFVIELPEDTL